MSHTYVIVLRVTLHIARLRQRNSCHFVRQHSAPVSHTSRPAYLSHVTAANTSKVKPSHYRPGNALRFPGNWSSQISRQSAHEGGKVVSLTHRPPLTPPPPGNIPGTHFSQRLSRPQGHKCDRKDYVNEKFHWQRRESNPRPSGV
jgi:hypothetical protein